MTVIDQDQAKAVTSRFEPCEHCGAPLDHQQRYCVSCAARRSDPSNPATRYFAAASRRARLVKTASARPAQSGSQFRASAVAVLILLPAAVGVGVLVGRSSDDKNGDSADLAAAIREGGLASSSAGTGGDGTLASDTSGGALTSDFSLAKGYTVELTTIDGSSDQDAVDKAKSDAEDKGAEDVGVIVPDDYAVTPDPGGDLVIYSGEFEKKPDAEAALKKLKGDFPDAKVVAVKAASSGGGDQDPSNGAGGDLVEKSDYGDVHKVEGAEPTEADQEEGSQIAQDQADSTGGNYIDSQQGLPDVIAVGSP
jgi:hypothetical protein